jgi:hypothetical protein
MNLRERKLSIVREQTHEDFNWGSMMVVLFLFLFFMGTSVYLMLTNY